MLDGGKDLSNIVIARCGKEGRNLIGNNKMSIAFIQFYLIIIINAIVFSLEK